MEKDEEEKWINQKGDLSFNALTMNALSNSEMCTHKKEENWRALEEK